MHFDASAIIHAWDNYPIANFPPFWTWISHEIADDRFAISDVAFDEVDNKAPECAKWLKEKKIRKIVLTNEILISAGECKLLLGIVAENYHPNGVGENDLLIIAAAKIENTILITEESRQNILPIDKRKYKIPAVCGIDDIGVTSKNIRELITESSKVFI